MIRTRVGYTGGSKANPTYHSLGDHSEAIRIDFDPEIIPYEKLLAVFWQSHKPAQRAWRRQYMNALFYHDDAQRRQAEATRDRLQQTTGKPVRTQLLALTTFYRAEDYHQKYMLRGRKPFAEELEQIYPRPRDFVDSTLAARLNGYLGGYGRWEQLAKEIDTYGLNPANRRNLERVVRKS